MAIDLPPETLQFMADQLNAHGIVNEDEAKVPSTALEATYSLDRWRDELRAQPRPYEGGNLRVEVYRPRDGGLYALCSDRLDRDDAQAILANYYRRRTEDV